MVKKKLVDEGLKNEVKKIKILTISLPAELYQFLLGKSGKGNIGNFVREAIEEKIMKEENALISAYKLLEGSEVYGDINFQETGKKKKKKLVMNYQNSVRVKQERQKNN